MTSWPLSIMLRWTGRRVLSLGWWLIWAAQDLENKDLSDPLTEADGAID